MRNIIKSGLLLLKPLVHKLARLFELSIESAYEPQGQGKIYFADKMNIVKHQIPKSTYFNTASGDIRIGHNVVFGEFVLLLTGKHLAETEATLAKESLFAVPRSGRDIIIEDNVYIGSGAIIVGPCKIGQHSVIGAGSVVTKDVEPKSFIVGNPAILKRKLT